MNSPPSKNLSPCSWPYQVQFTAAPWFVRREVQRHQILVPRIWLLLVLLLPSVASACTVVMPGTVTNPDSLTEYWRSGGFAGLDDHLVVSDTGHVAITRYDKTIEYDLTPEELDETVHLLQSVDFASLDKSYSAGQGADLIEYKIWYGGHLVQAEDSVVPSELEPLFEHLDGLLSKTS